MTSPPPFSYIYVLKSERRLRRISAVSTDKTFCFRYFSHRAIRDRGFFSEVMNYPDGVSSNEGVSSRIRSIYDPRIAITRRRMHEARNKFDGNRLRQFWTGFGKCNYRATSRMHFVSHWRTFSFAFSARSAICFQNFDTIDKRILRFLRRVFNTLPNKFRRLNVKKALLRVSISLYKNKPRFLLD